MANLFRFLHISDLHCASLENHLDPTQLSKLGVGRSILFTLMGRNSNIFYPSTYDPDLLAKTAEFAFENKSNIDAVIVTGDIATTGFDSDLEVAKKFIDSDSFIDYRNHELKPTLQSCELQLLIIPGNHDRYSDLRGTPGHRNFENYFKNYWPASDYSYSAVFTKNEDNVGFVFVDFTLKKRSDANNPLGVFGQGKAYDDRVVGLLSHTHKLKNEFSNIPVAWVMHFPPKFEGISNSLKLINENKIIKAAKDNNISLILAGHSHISREYLLADTVRVCCSGSTTGMSKEINTLSYLEFTINEGNMTDINYRILEWNDQRGNFI